MPRQLTLPLLTLISLLSGCANDKPLPPTSKVVQTQKVISANQSQIDVEGVQMLETDFSRPSDTQLRYVTQGDTSKVAALKTLQFVSMMFAGGGNVPGFTKDELKGTEVAGFMNPSLPYLMPRITEILKTELDKHPSKKYDSAVTITPITWKLVYKNLAGGDDNYQLLFSTIIHRSGKGVANSSLSQDVNCGDDVNVQEYTLQQWQANSYAKVTEETQKMLESCVVKFSGAARLFLFDATTLTQ
ncbi:hypothetical protein [Pantoea sp. USHLN256]|uniref:hypothetical protein n=1 Tax=Pantoea sp. USHLN256 TaxID=3081293 RepID=UPI00301ADDD9